MLHHLGILLQGCVLVFLPCLVLWQLDNGVPLVVMPVSLVAGIFLFWLGTSLREGT